MSTVFRKYDRRSDPKAPPKNDATTKFARNMIIVAVMSTFLHFYVAIGVITLVAIAFCILPGIREKIFIHKGTWCFGIFTLLTTVVGIYHKNYLGALIGVLVAFMFIIYLVARSLANAEFFDRMLDSLCVGGCLSTVVCVIERIVNRNIPNYRCQCFSVNANCFGVAIAYVILICAYKAVVVEKNVYRYYLAAVINAVSLYLCGSMMLWVVVFFGVVTLLVFNHKYKLLSVFLGLATVGIVAIVLAPQILPRLSELTATIENRVSIWSFAIEQIKEAPFLGRGYATYNFLYNMMAPSRPELYPAMLSHNLLVDGLLSYGIVGMLLLGGFFVSFIKAVLDCREGLKSRNQCYVIMTFVCALAIAVAIHGIIDTAMIWIQPGMIIMLIASGIGVAENELKQSIIEEKMQK